MLKLLSYTSLAIGEMNTLYSYNEHFQGEPTRVEEGGLSEEEVKIRFPE
jgi:hypothetical protein